MLEAVAGAVGGVWLVFEEVYGVKSKKCRQIFWPPPPFQISKYATACEQDLYMSMLLSLRTPELPVRAVFFVSAFSLHNPSAKFTCSEIL
jgi:hypothetical protein